MLIRGTAGDDELHGTADSDRIIANEGADVVFGDSGNDVIFTGTPSGRDAVDPGESNIVHAGEGDDSVHGSDVPDTIELGPGNDFADGGGDADLLFGEEGDDTLVVGNADRASGGPGDDRFELVADGSGRFAFGLGDEGNDVFVAHSANVIVDGSSGDDELRAGELAQVELQNAFATRNIERVDVTGGQGSNILVSPEGVKEISETDTLTITGDRRDMIDVSAWNLVGQEQGFNVYEADGARLLLDPDLMTLS